MIGVAIAATAPRRNKPQVAGSRNRITRSATCSALAQFRSIAGDLKCQGVADGSLVDLCPTESALARRQGKQMHDRTHTSKPLVRARPPELKESGRDLRIDACR